MKQFTDITNKVIKYFEQRKQYFLGNENNKWFEENKPTDNEIETAKKELFQILETKVIDTGSHSAIKEMIDFISTVQRANIIRNKTRVNFFIDNAVRNEGNVCMLNRKKIRLSNMIKLIGDR